MLFRVLRRMIECGQTERMTEKLDLFFAANKLTHAEYMQLSQMLA